MPCEFHKKSITSLQVHDDASGAESENYEQSAPPGTVFPTTRLFLPVFVRIVFVNPLLGTVFPSMLPVFFRIVFATPSPGRLFPSNRNTSLISQLRVVNCARSSNFVFISHLSSLRPDHFSDLASKGATGMMSDKTRLWRLETIIIAQLGPHQTRNYCYSTYILSILFFIEHLNSHLCSAGPPKSL